MAHDAIVSDENLFNHRIPVNPRCVPCGFYNANTSHSIIYCQGVRELWKNLDWWFPLKNLKGQRTIDLLYNLHSIAQKEKFEEICTKMWKIWKDRCDATHKVNRNYPLYSKGSTEHWPAVYLEEFRKAQEKIGNPSIPLTKRYAPKTSRVSQKNFSLYVDAAVKDASCEYDVGFAIKDPQDNLWAIGFHQISPPDSIMAG